MTHLLLIAVLAQAPDAPLAERRPDGSVLFSREGYANLSRETTRLQLELADAKQRVADLESAPRLTVPLIVTLVGTSIAVGFVAAWQLKGSQR